MKPVLTYVSLFSGIEACSVAMSRITDVNWKPVFFSEIDPFPCAVLAHRFPSVPNLGDVCKIRVETRTNPETNETEKVITNGTATIPFPRMGVDILAGGSPCQDVSVAGLRKGMRQGSATRSSLAFEYARLVEELRPRVLLWENVPGVLSSNGGRDFGDFLHSLAQLGYCLAWRVLDVQHTRVDGFPGATPQRRRRVWLVGCLGDDGRVPAEILFERPSLLGDTPPRRKAGQGFAAPAGYCASGDDCVVGDAGFDLQAFGKYGEQGVASTLKSRDWKDATDLAVQTTPVSPSVLCANSNGEDVAATLDAKGNSTSGIGAQNDKRDGYVLAIFENHAQDSRVREKEVCPTIGASNANGVGPGGNNPLVCAIRTANTHANGHGVAEEVSHTCDRAQGQAVAIGFKPGQSGREDTGSLGAQPEQSPTLPREPGGMGIGVAVGFNHTTPDESAIAAMHTEFSEPISASAGGSRAVIQDVDPYNGATTGDVSATLGVNAGLATGRNAVLMHYIVRRLTPGECETLQAFPQGWTKIPYRGKPADQCPDSPRYKALGNSWGTNCAEWILRRIVAAFRLGMI